MLEVPQKTKLSNCNICLDLTHVISLVGNGISVSPYEAKLVGSVGFFVVFLPPLAHTILSSLFPLDSLRSAQCLAMVICIYFHQLLGEQLLTIGLVNDL